MYGGTSEPLRCQLQPLFQPADLSGLCSLLIHGLRAEGGPLAGLFSGLPDTELQSAECQSRAEPCPAKSQQVACQCGAQLARFRSCLAGFGILASDVLRILSAVALLRGITFRRSRAFAAGAKDTIADCDRDCHCCDVDSDDDEDPLVVCEQDLLNALAQTLGVEEKVLEAGLLWDVDSMQQVYFCVSSVEHSRKTVPKVI
jgi:hypothetical protein